MTILNPAKEHATVQPSPVMTQSTCAYRMGFARRMNDLPAGPNYFDGADAIHRRNWLKGWQDADSMLRRI